MYALHDFFYKVAHHNNTPHTPSRSHHNYTITIIFEPYSSSWGYYEYEI